MLVVKKTIQWNGKLKNLTVDHGVIYDEDNNQVDLIALVEMAFDNKVFDITVVSKEEDQKEFDHETVD